jgi:hypothetical protein
MKPRNSWTWPALVLVAITDRGWAQYGLWPDPVLPGLTRVEEGVADVGPLSMSQRLVPVDLRTPTGFQGVYQFQRAVPFGKAETMYARASGGLWATFPRSVYVAAPGGLAPEIPAGTVFMIGRPPEYAAPRRGPSGLPTAVDMSVQWQVEPPRPGPPVVRAAAPSEPLTIWNSDRLRQQRLGRLMESLITPSGR